MVALSTPAIGVPAHAVDEVVRPAAPTPLGSWGAWRAATHREGGTLTCYAWSRARTSSPALHGRGDVVLTVTERRGAPRDAVAISVGFVYPPGSTVDLVAGHTRLAFYTAQRSAFARNGRASTRALSHAAEAVVHSQDPRTGEVTDRFALAGFDDAHAAIVKACPEHAPPARGRGDG